MIKILLGGSPCTFWSIARAGRETHPSGVGWELFENYLIAKEKFQPDFFIYENNQKIHSSIVEEIRRLLGCGTDSNTHCIEIDSALVSAQKRRRFYIHNCGNVKQPADRDILFQDILDNGIVERDKAYCLTCHEGNTRDYFLKRQTNLVFIPIYDELAANKSKNISNDKYYRIYFADGKAATMCAGDIQSVLDNGLHLPLFSGTYSFETSGSIKPANPKLPSPIYEIRNGEILIRGRKYPVNLKDGLYTIRKLSSAECCRLQTLPEDYCRSVSNTQAYRCIGNGWTAEVIIHILSYALRNIPKNEEVVVLSLYDGIGTGRYCLNKMGFTNVKYYAYEIDKHAIKVATSNFSDIIECGDAFQVREQLFSETFPPIWKIKSSAERLSP